jgi:hypothetical protein
VIALTQGGGEWLLAARLRLRPDPDPVLAHLRHHPEPACIDGVLVRPYLSAVGIHPYRRECMACMGLIFLAIGLAAGGLSGLFGIGGGLLIVPTLVAVGNFSITTALGTSLASLLLPVGLLGACAYSAPMPTIRAAR